jgi:hypothetical protein
MLFSKTHSQKMVRKGKTGFPVATYWNGWQYWRHQTIMETSVCPKELAIVFNVVAIINFNFWSLLINWACASVMNVGNEHNLQKKHRKADEDFTMFLKLWHCRRGWPRKRGSRVRATEVWGRITKHTFSFYSTTISCADELGAWIYRKN